jgi:hypothetical protein
MQNYQPGVRYICENRTVESNCFSSVRSYVKNGFDKDSAWYDIMVSTNDIVLPGHPANPEMPTVIYKDYDSQTGTREYDSYPPDVKFAATFRDGMVYADTNYYENITHPLYGQQWAEIFKENCRIVFDYLNGVEMEDDDDVAECSVDGHKFIRFTDDEDDDDDKPPRCSCASAYNESLFLDYCCSEVEGGQSQSLIVYISIYLYDVCNINFKMFNTF